MELKLGMIIKKLRNDRGMTQEELANQLGVSFQAVSKWETNTTLPDVALLPQIALFFGISMDEMFSMNRDDYIEKIAKMIRDEYSISSESFTWAERYLKGLLSEDKNNIEARTLLVELYEHRESRDSLAQIRLCEEGLSMDPYDIALTGKLVRAREMRNDPVKLISFFESLYAADSHNDIAADVLIQSYIKYGKCELAVNLMASAEKRPIFGIYQGDIELASGHKKAARDFWLTAVRENSGDSRMLFEAAERFSKINETEMALKLYKQSYNAAPYPKEMDALYAQAFLYANSGRKTEAIEVWQAIIRSLDIDYNIREGECVDWAKREIRNLSC